MKTSSCVTTLLLGLAVRAAQADAGLYNTGVDGQGQTLAIGAADSHYVLVAGDSIGFPVTPGYSSFAAFSIGSGFVDGINTLAFRVGNYSGPTGLRTELSGNFVSSVVPEPAAWSLLAAGMLLLAARRQRSSAA